MTAKKQRKLVLSVDDDPDILDIIELTLNDDFDVTTAPNGEEGLQKVYELSPDLVILDYMMPKMTGIEACRRIKSDSLLRHIPVIMLTGKGDLSDKVEGLGAGADDYLVKPFEPEELIARVKMIIRRSELDLDANPLTRLPGNISITTELEQRIAAKEPFAVCYSDLDKFKAYNDTYGFKRGDEVIRKTAHLLREVANALGDDKDFIGHIGGDDFVIITTPDKSDMLCRALVQKFDALAPTLYTEEDRQKGFIISKDRQGTKVETPFISISIGVVIDPGGTIHHPAEIGERGAELKAYAKSQEGSIYVKERRTQEREN